MRDETNSLLARLARSVAARRPTPCARWLALAVFLLSLTTACGGTGDEGLSSSMIRFIEDDPGESLEIADLFESSSVRDWRFSGEDQGLSGWTIADPGGVEWTATPQGLHLRSDGGRVILARYQEPDRGDFDAVEVELRPAPDEAGTGTVVLAWAAEAERLSRERRIVQRDENDPGAPDRTYRFMLRGHPGWRSPSSRLRLAFHHPPGGVIVSRISLVRQVPAAARLARLVERGVKAKLGSEFRNALLGVPGAPTRRPLAVPRDAVLRFSYGLPETLSGPVRFRVWFDPEQGDRTMLFEDVLEPGEDSGRWHQARAALDQLEGTTGHIEFHTLAAGSFDPLQGFPLWGNPRVTLPPRRRPPNVVLISVDTLRPDRMSLYGHERRTSPVLDEWARTSAAVFQAAVAQSTWTLPSHVSMLTGLDAFRHGVNFFDATAPASLVFLQEILREAGYSTLAATGGGLMHPRYGFDQGFDRYWFYPDSRATGEELSRGLDRALSWLDEAGDAPFFLFFHTYEVHTPWRSRQPWFEEFSDLPPVEDLRLKNPAPRPEEGFLGIIRDSALDLVSPGPASELGKAGLLELAGAAYDSGIAYTDAQLGRLLAKLAERGLDENTIVVFTSDHGELLGEHGVLGHRYLYEENIRVPLVIATPDGAGAGRRIDSQVRSIDIVPTVLGLVGLEPPQGVDGRSLVSLIEEDEDAGTPPRAEAWTYAPEVNYGVSVRVNNRLKYTFNDTAWPQLNGAEDVYVVGDGFDESAGVLSDFQGIDALYRSVRQKIALVPGLRIRLQSGPDRRIRGFVRGVHPNRVKSVDLPCACVTWEPGKAVFEVPPGSEYTLVIQGGGTDPYTLGLTNPDESTAHGTRLERQLAAEELGRGRHLFVGLTDAGWQELPGPPQSPPHVEIWWHGQATPGDEPTAVDPELVERLRALGYLR